MTLRKNTHLAEAQKLHQETNLSATEISAVLCLKYRITDPLGTQARKVRGWLQDSNVKSIKEPKIMVYDVETTRQKAHVWGTGKQYIRHDQMEGEQRIITISWKWLGDNKMNSLVWNQKKKCDRKLMKTFLAAYNQADMVIGQNNNAYDNKLINTRAMKYNFDVDTQIKSFDIMKQCKKVFKLDSFSMAYIARYTGLQGKLAHTGIQMWMDVQYGDKKAAKKALKLMSKYNDQDVLVTEEMYFRLRKYLGNIIHIGALVGECKTTCPECGGTNISHYKTTVTQAGTIQHIVRCDDDKVKFKLSNTAYLKLNNG